MALALALQLLPALTSSLSVTRELTPVVVSILQASRASRIETGRVLSNCGEDADRLEFEVGRVALEAILRGHLDEHPLEVTSALPLAGNRGQLEEVTEPLLRNLQFVRRGQELAERVTEFAQTNKAFR